MDLRELLPSSSPGLPGGEPEPALPRLELAQPCAPSRYVLESTGFRLPPASFFTFETSSL